MPLRPVALCAALLVAAGSAGCARRPRPPAEGAAELSARVVRVVDGDTIAVSVGGTVEKVRYIGMDTPETVKPGTPVQCYGKRASARNRRLVADRRVLLRFDRERRDRYGRLLAYVYAHGRMVNAELVRRGFATTLTIPPNDSKAGLLAGLQSQAQARRRGLWSACPLSAR